MNTEPLIMDEQEQKAVVLICLMAAFSDGSQSEIERAQVKRVVERFSNDKLDLSAACQEVLAGKATLTSVASQLQSTNGKALAYEMAVCVCNADQALSEAEKQFLANLRRELNLEAAPANAFQQRAGDLAAEPFRQPPVIAHAPSPGEDIDAIILNGAKLNGALEIMPHSIATMAIIPLQMRMVYRIGKSYGYDLSGASIKDFLATVGIGLTSQVVEGYLGRLMGGLGRHLAGGLLGGLVGQAAESGFAFASTYALGQVAKRYYASGRTLSTAQLQEVFSSMLSEGGLMKSRYAGDIAQRARTVNVNELLPLVRKGF